MRVRDLKVELTDGPFATTKEVLVGYYLLDCANLDEALRHAASLPLAAYGSVEVQPIASYEDVRGEWPITSREDIHGE